MKLAQENPKKYEGKKFKYTKGGIPVTSRGEQSKEFFISQYGEFLPESRVLKLFITDTTEVEEIQQPITIQEAARLFDEERKTVICEFPDCNNKTSIVRYPFKPEPYGGMKLSDEITFYMINSGKWYLEGCHE
jgi:hypothetical protein